MLQQHELEKHGAVRVCPNARSRSGLVSVYLFGSAARGNLHRDSDVDVALLLDRGLHPPEPGRGDLRLELGAQLIAATGENEIDLVFLDDLPPGLARAIVVDGRRLLCLDPELDHAFVRDTQLRWADLKPFLERVAILKLAALGR